MTYSVGLRERVVAFGRGGGSKTEAARLFGVHRQTVYSWLKAKSLESKKHGRCKPKLDWEALQRDIDEHPNKLLRERAAKSGVRVNAIWYAAQKTKKGKKTFRCAEA